MPPVVIFVDRKRLLTTLYFNQKPELNSCQSPHNSSTTFMSDRGALLLKKQLTGEYESLLYIASSNKLDHYYNTISLITNKSTRNTPLLLLSSPVLKLCFAVIPTQSVKYIKIVTVPGN